MANVNRRTIIAAAPFAVAGGASWSPAALATTDPLPALVADWKRAYADWMAAVHEPGAGNMDTPKCLAAKAEVDRLSELICTTVPTTSQGAAAQLEYALDDFGDYITGNIEKDHGRKLLENLLAGLKGGVA